MWPSDCLKNAELYTIAHHSFNMSFCSVDNNERSPSDLEENATISKRSQQGMCLDRQVRHVFKDNTSQQGLQYVQPPTLVCSLLHALRAYIASW